MMPDIVQKMPPQTQATFNRAYDNSKKRPIGWWDPDKDAVGLIQAWLLALGESMAKSASFELDDDTITADGVFGDETFHAVQSFQRKNRLTADGMVGHDTLDSLREALKKRTFVPPVQTTTEVIIVGTPPRPCPPGALICPDR
jgi:peptidoglycan hydrolase-like protein with peptidoglycan-binding domain